MIHKALEYFTKFWNCSPFVNRERIYNCYEEVVYQTLPHFRIAYVGLLLLTQLLFLRIPIQRLLINNVVIILYHLSGTACGKTIRIFHLSVTIQQILYSRPPMSNSMGLTFSQYNFGIDLLNKLTAKVETRLVHYSHILQPKNSLFECNFSIFTDDG